MSAKRVSSLPRPTLRPGLWRVPRWRIRIVPAWTNSPPNRFTPSRCPCESRPFTEEPPPFLCAIRLSLFRRAPSRRRARALWRRRAEPAPDWSSLKLDAADLDGRIVLPVTPADLVLAARLKFENRDFRMPPLRDDFSNDFRLRGVGSGQKLLLVGPHGQHVFKGNLPADLAGKGFDLHGVARRHTILFAATSNDGVHRPSICRSETPIIGVVLPKVNAQVAMVARQCALAYHPATIGHHNLKNVRRSYDQENVVCAWCNGAIGGNRIGSGREIRFAIRHQGDGRRQIDSIFGHRPSQPIGTSLYAGRRLP